MQLGHLYHCTCAPGWSGKLCDVEMVSCKDAALRKGKFKLFLNLCCRKNVNIFLYLRC